jgi:hypothetical protein
VIVGLRANDTIEGTRTIDNDYACGNGGRDVFLGGGAFLSGGKGADYLRGDARRMLRDPGGDLDIGTGIVDEVGWQQLIGGRGFDVLTTLDDEFLPEGAGRFFLFGKARRRPAQHG